MNLSLMLLFLFICLLPNRARADEPASPNEARAAPPQGSATPKDSCAIEGRYRVALRFTQDYGEGLCPSSKESLEFSVRDAGGELTAQVTKGARALKFRKRLRVEISRQNEPACSFELRVSSGDDMTDDTSLTLRLKRAATAVQGTGTFERMVTASAGNATGSRSEQCSMEISASGEVTQR